MPKQKLPPNAPCPCESGRSYGRCCYDKGFEYLVDDDGTVYKAVPVPDELAGYFLPTKRLSRIRS